MIRVLSPQLDEIRQIQERDGAYYWSIGAVHALRAIGLISVRDVEPSDARVGGPLLVLRDTEITPDTWMAIKGSPVAFETPLHDSVKALLRVEPKADTFAALDLSHPEATAPSGRLEPPRPLVREADEESRPFRPADRRWAWDAIKYHDPGWSHVSSTAFAVPELGTTGALLQTRANVAIITVPLFDLACRWTAWPPMDELYAGMASASSPFPVLAQVAGAMVQGVLSLAAGHAIVAADDLPVGKSAALTVRHDYDRDIDTESCVSLLRYYDRLGIKASVGFLAYRLPAEQIRLFAAGGHEIQLHDHAQTLWQFQRGLERLTAVAGREIQGFTAHGGPSGRKFRGDHHFRWAEASGLSYTDSRGPRNGYVLPVMRVEEGVPYQSPIVATSDWFSLDRSTRPGDHLLDALSKKLPKALAIGENVTLMNHPDIHREALLELLGRLDLSNVWLATSAEIVAHSVATRMRSLVLEQADRLEIRIPAPLSVDASFRVRGQGGRHERVVLPAGATSTGMHTRAN